MAGPQLKPEQIDVIRLVARGYSNLQIADHLGIPLQTFRSRLATIHRLIGTAAATEINGVLSRARMVAWAYEHGLVTPKQPAIPVVNSGPVLDEWLLIMARMIVRDEPLGALRAHAERLVRAVDGPAKRRAA